MVSNTLMEEADIYIYNLYQELGKTDQEIEARREAVQKEIKRTGTYKHTYEELSYGAKIAWRNSNHCIGRLFWNHLEVIDARGIDTPDKIFEALLQHIKTATNGGKIKPLITIFNSDTNGGKPIKIHNHQLIRYAGYQTESGVVGDPHSIKFTELCMKLGWEGAGTPFDVLPLVIECNNKDYYFKEIPKTYVLEVPIKHPDESIFDMEVKWYAVPIISDMRLEIGGINYPAAPFNGWYMGTEIGARNLADEDRYDLLPHVAQQMNISKKHLSTLWKDKALVALNVAVLESFKANGVAIVDHHTAAKQFKVFEKKERIAGRDITGRWSWLLPPMSPATSHIFHKPYKNIENKPNYFYK